MTTLELYTKVWFTASFLFSTPVPVNLSLIFISRVFSCFQEARVWIPHSQVVWIGGELTKDLKEDGILEIELEDGNVSLFSSIYKST